MGCGMRNCCAWSAGARYHGMACAGPCGCSMGHWCTGAIGSRASHCRAAAGKTAAIGHGAAAAAIAPAAAIDEAMAAPAVAIAPAGPWAHAQEDAVVEVARPVKSIGRAGVGRIVVIAVGTDRLNADADYDLRLAAGARARPASNAVVPSRVLSPRMCDPLKVSAVPCVAWDAVCSRKD